MAFSFGRMKSAAMGHLALGTLPIAVDFGASSLKVLQLEGGDAPSLIAAAAVDVPDNIRHDAGKRFAFQFQALPKLIRSAGFKGRRAMCAIPAAHMFCKHMQFPKAEGVDLKSLVQAAVHQHLACPPEALVYRHVPVEGAQPVGSGAGKTEVICLAAAREMIGRMMIALREARLECVGMHPEYSATMAAFAHLNRRADDANLATLYLDLAYGTTKVAIGHGTNLVFAKTVPMAGAEFDEAVARALDVQTGEARARRLAAAELVAHPAPGPKTPGAAGHAMLNAARRQAGAGDAPAEGDSPVALADERRVGLPVPGSSGDVLDQPPARVATEEFDLGDQLEVLTDEVAGCLRYYEAIFPGRKVQRAVLFGGESRHRGLCQQVARRIRLSAQVADPVARMARTGSEPCVGVDFSQPQPGWTVAFGLSLCPPDL